MVALFCAIALYYHYHDGSKCLLACWTFSFYIGLLVATRGEAAMKFLKARGLSGDAVLILRGLDASGEPVTDTQGSGREWLAEQIRARQGQVHYQAVYQRKAPSNLPPWVLEQPPRELVWLFSSSQAVQHLQQCAPSPLFWQHHRALATHPRIAQTATDLGFETVEVVPPQPDAIAQRLQSWVSR